MTDNRNQQSERNPGSQSGQGPRDMERNKNDRDRSKENDRSSEREDRSSQQ